MLLSMNLFEIFFQLVSRLFTFLNLIFSIVFSSNRVQVRKCLSSYDTKDKFVTDGLEKETLPCLLKISGKRKLLMMPRYARLYEAIRLLKNCICSCHALHLMFILMYLWHISNWYFLVLQKPDGERDDLGEFLYQYLQRRFGVENMIIEWGYNLYDACGRYSHDPRIGLFYGILQKEVGIDILIFTFSCKFAILC